MNRLCATVISLSATLFLARNAPAQSVPGARAIDRVFADVAKPGSPGCALAVARDGRIVYEKGYGSANLDWDIPISPATVFNIGSTSKQFVAAAILLLAEDGKLSLDDPMRRWLPEMHDFGAPITVRQLLHHTSGVRDLLELMNVVAGLNPDNRYTNADFMRILAAQRELNFPPGSQFLYSNSGYFLLGHVVERVSGKTLRQFTEERIFRPLGMDDSHFHDDYRMVVKNRALAYTRQNDRWIQDFTFNFDRVGPGGLNTTARDLVKWNDALFNGRIGGTGFLEKMLTRGVLMNGDTLGYALGLEHVRHRGLDLVAHGGSSLGFRADLMRIPSERLDVVTLCNTPTPIASVLGRQVADLFLADRLGPAVAQRTPAPAAPAPTHATPDAAALAAYSGRYRSSELDLVFTLRASRNGLILQRANGDEIVLTPSGQDRFRLLQRTTIEFQRDNAGRITGFLWQGNRVRHLRFERFSG
jgi:CubicO group peptidase (beta-lactamase class C family)